MTKVKAMGEGQTRDCCEIMMAGMLGIINMITSLIGAATLGLGLFLFFTEDDYFPQSLKDDYSLSLNPVSIALIVLGALLIIIGMFGYSGARSGSRRVLNVYLFLMITIVILEIGVIALGYVRRSAVEDEAKDAFKDVFNKYNNGNATDLEESAVEKIQQNLECCGLDGQSSWNDTRFGSTSVPASCCSDFTDTTSNPFCHKTGAYTLACEAEAISMIDNFVMVLLIALLLSIIFQILCMIAACHVKIKKRSVRC